MFKSRIQIIDTGDLIEQDVLVFSIKSLSSNVKKKYNEYIKIKV